MRFRAVLCLFFLIILVVMGCRKPLKPNVDRNQAPETWITAAPQDTITERDESGLPVIHIGTISYKYHLYWAGSDQDGAVAGFYFAVVETLPRPAPGFSTIPPLPGPKPSDYRFTAKTDSVFLFNTSEFANTRQHAFFIYAVDNQGKADPTPARLYFNALDNYPPLPVIDRFHATGVLWALGADHLPHSRPYEREITDSLTHDNFFKSPKDSVPSNARIDIHWRGEPVVAGTFVAGYQYKLDEPDFVHVDSSVHVVSYNTGVNGDHLQLGGKVFTLRAVSPSGWVHEVNRRFQLNMMPDTWFSGPDPSLYPADSSGQRYLTFRSQSDWNSIPFPGSLLSCDSVQTWPAERPEKRTFFEIYKDRVYVRSEGDTVHLNSWVVFQNGGLDPDSPFAVKINPDTTSPPPTSCPEPLKMLHPSGPNGSPIGFHLLMTIFKSPNGPYDVPAQSGLYPIFDPGNVFYSALIANYQPMRYAGTAYVTARAEDADGAQDRSVNNPRQTADDVDSTAYTPEESFVRHKIIRFFVDRAPFLRRDAGGFHPTDNEVLASRHVILNLVADDEDPLDPDVSPPPAVGGPTASKVLRYNIRLVNACGVFNDTCTKFMTEPVYDPHVPLDIPDDVRGTHATLEVQLCDCPSCEVVAGQGRCRTYYIPIQFPAPPPLAFHPDCTSQPTTSLCYPSGIPPQTETSSNGHRPGPGPFSRGGKRSFSP
jgi:hypothetical protein